MKRPIHKGDNNVFSITPYQMLLPHWPSGVSSQTPQNKNVQLNYRGCSTNYTCDTLHARQLRQALSTLDTFIGRALSTVALATRTEEVPSTPPPLHRTEWTNYMEAWIMAVPPVFQTHRRATGVDQSYHTHTTTYRGCTNVHTLLLNARMVTTRTHPFAQQLHHRRAP